MQWIIICSCLVTITAFLLFSTEDSIMSQTLFCRHGCRGRGSHLASRPFCGNGGGGGGGRGCGCGMGRGGSMWTSQQTKDVNNGQHDFPGGMGMGYRGGRGGGGYRGGYGQQQHQRGGHHHDTIQELFDNIDSITRQVNEIVDEETNEVVGIESTTTSSDIEVAANIQKHVAQMKEIKESGGMVRRWDPLFYKVFEEGNHISFDVDNVHDGVHVKQTGDTPCAAALVQAHASVVSKFVAHGRAEAKKEHEVPDACEE